MHLTGSLGDLVSVVRTRVDVLGEKDADSEFETRNENLGFERNIIIVTRHSYAI